MDKGPLVNKRQIQYKINTPPWKETYRKRCQERLKKSRAQFLDRLRGCEVNCTEPDSDISSTVDDLMHEEWKILRCEQNGTTTSSQHNGNGPVHEDEYISIFEEIRAELIREEQQILAEYEAGLHHEEAALHASLLSSSDDILCPVCQKNRLHLNKGVVFCACGVRLETDQDCLTLQNIRYNLEQGPTFHSPACMGQAKFSVVNEIGIKNMLMTCTICDFMHIII